MLSMRLMIAAQLMYFYGLTVLVTVIVSFAALWRYGRAVLDGMAHRDPDAPPLPLPVDRPAVPMRSESPLPWDLMFGRRVVVAWLLATFVAALPLACVYLIAHGRLDNGIAVIAVASAMTMVVLPVIGVARGWHWRRGVVFGIVLALGTATTMVALSSLERLLHGGAAGRDQLLAFVRWFKFAGLALGPLFAVLALCMQRRIRQMVPLIFSALLLFGLAPFAGTRAFDTLVEHDSSLRLVLLSDIVDGGMEVVRYAPFLLLAVPAGMLVTWRLRVLAAAYAAKRFSSVELQARAWWLMLCALIAFEMANNVDVPWWGPWGMAAAGLGYAPIQHALFRLLDIARGAPTASTLLFLRAFGYRARTERLIDRIGARWRSLGPILMIAAPDVVARTIDSANLLAWLQGREADTFVRTQAELDARLAAIDGARDPDGLFRTNGFCCSETTWRATAVALMGRAHVVLMDLRGVKDEKFGCAFELTQLAERNKGGCVVLVVDKDTLLAPIQDAIGAAGAQMTWHRMDDERPASFERLFAVLARAARSSDQPPPMSSIDSAPESAEAMVWQVNAGAAGMNGSASDSG